MVSGAFLSLTKIISSIRLLIVCTSCKTLYNVLSHSHWGLDQFFGGGGGGGGGVKKRLSPDFRSPEVGISAKHKPQTAVCSYAFAVSHCRDFEF